MTHGILGRKMKAKKINLPGSNWTEKNQKHTLS